MNKILFLCMFMAAMCISSNAQDTLITAQGKAYLAVVTKVEKDQIHYTRYPQAKGDKEESLDVRALREIRFYDGRHVNYIDSNFGNIEGLNIAVDPVRMKPPSYYLKRSAYCQYGAFAASFGAGFSGALGAIVAATPNSDPSGPYFLYGASAVLGLTAIICTISSIVNLEKAGESLERIHIIQNGISFDL